MSFSCFWITEKEQKDNLGTGKVMLRGKDLESLVFTPHCLDALRALVPPRLSYSSLLGCKLGICLPPTPVLLLTECSPGPCHPTPVWVHSRSLSSPPCLTLHCLDAVWAPVPQLHHNIAFTEVCVWGVVANDRARKMKALMTKPHD